MFNGSTVLKDFNIAVCLKKIVTTLLAKSARNLINNYLSRPRIAFFRMRRQAKKTTFRVTNAMVLDNTRNYNSR